jgi:exonuclease SbcD
VSSGCVVRVTLSGEIGPDVDLRLQDVNSLPVPHLDALVVRLGRVFPRYDLEQLKSEPTVRGQFVQDVLGSSELDEDQRRRVLVTGLRALAGRGSELEVA